MQWAAYGDDCYARYDRSIIARYKAYLAGSCSDEIGGTRSIIVDQWTLSINEDTDWNEKGCQMQPGQFSGNKRWWAVQVNDPRYERGG
jgi:hypothetical protein